MTLGERITGISDRSSFADVTNKAICLIDKMRDRSAPLLPFEVNLLLVWLSGEGGDLASRLDSQPTN